MIDIIDAMSHNYSPEMVEDAETDFDVRYKSNRGKAHIHCVFICYDNPTAPVSCQGYHKHCPIVLYRGL